MCLGIHCLMRIPRPRMREKAGRKLPKMHFKQQNRRIQTTIRKSQAGMENDGSISKKPVYHPSTHRLLTIGPVLFCSRLLMD